MKYYLAYGSNLCKRQMAFRCPDAEPVGTGFITDYELLYKGSKTGAYLTIEQKKGGKVPVGIWKITVKDEESLDRYEGFPYFYYKQDVDISFTDAQTGKEVKTKALVYIMHENRQLGIPSEFYVATCHEGYMDFGFDTDFLNKAYETSLNNS